MLDERFERAMERLRAAAMKGAAELAINVETDDVLAVLDWCDDVLRADEEANAADEEE